MAEANNLGYELDWDSEIEKDGAEFITLPAGEYPFVVTKYERSRYTPKEGAKLPPCGMAIIYLEVDGGNLGTCTIKHNLYLHSTTEGLLCAFFSGIGQRQSGERIRMNWQAVPMSTGRAKLKVRKYTTKDGEERTINEVEKFLEHTKPANAAAGGYAQAPSGYQQPGVQQQFNQAPNGFEPGRF